MWYGIFCDTACDTCAAGIMVLCGLLLYMYGMVLLCDHCDIL